MFRNRVDVPVPALFGLILLADGCGTSDGAATPTGTGGRDGGVDSGRDGSATGGGGGGSGGDAGATGGAHSGGAGGIVRDGAPGGSGGATDGTDGSGSSVQVTFDFDTGTPSLARGEGIPFDQTSKGVTAHFSSPQGNAFSVQNDASTGWKMSQFSGLYLSDNNLNSNFLDIEFNTDLTSITLTFATADFQQVEVPTTIELKAHEGYFNSPLVGSATAHGTYGGDTMPMGTLSFGSSAPFNVVRLGIPYAPLAASDFLVDNVIVTTR